MAAASKFTGVPKETTLKNLLIHKLLLSGVSLKQKLHKNKKFSKLMISSRVFKMNWFLNRVRIN